MKRRQFLFVPLALGGTFAFADAPKVPSLDDSLRWLDSLEKAAQPKTTGAWRLSTVLDHLAQSIEMSMDGFSEAKSAVFQNTVGSAAFAFFKWRERMSHGLDEPIPGAPALTTGADWKPAALRLRRAIERFNGHGGALKPHFAYGSLSKSDFALAHSMHIANHRDEIQIV